MPYRPSVPEERDASTVALRPGAELAERVLLPGDPHRALAIARAELEQPAAMFNHRRGLWGYTGIARDGEPLTVQSTGIGGPSAAIVVEELIRLGARTLIRVGTCGALVPELELGELVVATEVIGADGTSAALGAAARQSTDAELTAALRTAGADRSGPIVTTDVFYDERPGVEDEWVDAGAIAVEMEAATVLAVAARHDVRAACLVAVTDQLSEGPPVRMADERIESAGLELGRVGAAALTDDA